ncbi:nucleotide cyclase [Lucifera butyrica]|uniref:Nucleotide cyclase n=2 Tax=Lucifera butyrica TaxID=1351585 RepID=A0A498R8S7_9FIRM|nr:nucleotide cyclase [Lucifera butyrica]
MGYRGRITGLLLIVGLVFIIRIWAYYSLNYPLTAPPLVGIVCLFIVWFLGKQYDKEKYYAERDALTGLYNRRFIDNVFPMFLAQMDRRNAKLSITILDCDNFKAINDHFGHKKGDLVLKGLSTILSAGIRKSDIAVRWGGDEFLIIAPYADKKDMGVILTRLKNELQELSKRLQIEISVSAGVAVYPDDAKNLDDLITLADIAMYSLKNHAL